MDIIQTDLMSVRILILPNELLHHIYSFLLLRDVFNVCVTCRLLYLNIPHIISWYQRIMNVHKSMSEIKYTFTSDTIDESGTRFSASIRYYNVISIYRLVQSRWSGTCSNSRLIYYKAIHDLYIEDYGGKCFNKMLRVGEFSPYMIITSDYEWHDRKLLMEIINK